MAANTENALIIDEQINAPLCFPIHPQKGQLNSRLCLGLCCSDWLEEAVVPWETEVKG